MNKYFLPIKSQQRKKKNPMEKKKLFTGKTSHNEVVSGDGGGYDVLFSFFFPQKMFF